MAAAFSGRIARRAVLVQFLLYLADTASAQTAGPRQSAAGYRVVNLMPTFWAFWEKAEKLPGPEKTRLFRRMVQEPNAAVFAAAVPSVSRDDFLVAYLEDLPRHIPAMRALSARLTAELPTYQQSFLAAFPDMAWSGDVYFLPSCFTFDGAVRQVGGLPALVFGVDMIAALHGEKGNVAPLFHHELFHAYHRTLTPDAFSGTFLGKMWTEGLAVFISQRLNPAATPAELLISSDLQRRSDADLPRLVREVQAKLDSRDFTDFRDYYDGGSTRPDVPARAGYYIGLLVVRDVAARMSLSDMARLQGEALRREVRTALRHLDGRPLSVEECREDIAAALAAVVTRKGSGEATRECERLEKSLTGPLSLAQLYSRLAPLIARLGTGRASLGYPAQVWATYRAGGGLSFPFSVRLREGHIFVADLAVPDYEIGVGAEIRAINGIPARRIAADVLGLSGADGVPAKEGEAADRFAINLYFLYDWRGPYNIEFLPAGGGKARSRIVDGVTESLSPAKPAETPGRTRILLPNSGLPLVIATG